MTAGILERLGVPMGDDMYPSSRANPLGYYEDEEFMSLNRTMLREAGGSPNDPPPLDALRALKEEFAPKIEQALKDRPPLWGWKDPVTALTIHLYEDHLEQPYIIVCHRDTKDIALSYNKMVGLSLSEIEELCEAYYASIDAFLADHADYPVLYVNYEDVVSAPKKWIDRIIAFTELHPSKEGRQQALHFVKPPTQMSLYRWMNMLKAGIEHPEKIIPYVRKRVRYFIDRNF